MDTKASPPAAKIAEDLRHLLGDMANVQELPDGFKIKVYHTRAFPWDDVFKMLLYRDYKVNLSRRKADIYIEAKP